MKTLVRGEKIKLDKINCGRSFDIGIFCGFKSGLADISCFGVDENGQLSDDRYFIFYNQKISPEGAISAMGEGNGYHETFRIHLEKLPPSIVRLVFTATLDTKKTFYSLKNSKFEIRNASGVVASYVFSGKDFTSETAIIIGEVYLKNVWRASAVGQGFNGGLSALLKHFGGDEITSPSPTPEPKTEPAPTPAPRPEPKPAPAPAPTINLSKIRLDKPGVVHKVLLDKGKEQYFHINLQWDSIEAKRSGFNLFFGNKSGADLDLGCFWRSKDGDMGVIQPLGESFGSKTSPPYIYLDKDDRTGMALDGENMHIYRPEFLEQVVIFALIYDGTANFEDVNARINIIDTKGNEIFIPLSQRNVGDIFCVVALITNDGQSINFQKEERYFSGHKECDEFYGYGFQWRSSHK